MPLARSRLQARRTELARAHGGLNLVPLVDILTAIVFFSLLSAVSLRSALASFDLAGPPAVADAAGGSSAAPSAVDLVVRVDRNQFVVRHGVRQTFIPRLQNRPDDALSDLRQTLTTLARGLGPVVVTVVPSDDVSYNDVVHVLEQVHQIGPKAVTLGSRARVVPD